MNVGGGPQRRLSAKELMLSNCVAGGYSWESLGLKGDQTSQSWRKSTEYSLEVLMIKLKFQYCGHSLEKTLMLGKIKSRRRRGATKDELVGWHHWFNGYEFEQTPGDSDGQGTLVCYSPWGHKESHTAEWPSSNNGNSIFSFFKEPAYCFPQWLCQFAAPPTV